MSTIQHLRMDFEDSIRYSLTVSELADATVTVLDSIVGDLRELSERVEDLEKHVAKPPYSSAG